MRVAAGLAAAAVLGLSAAANAQGSGRVLRYVPPVGDLRGTGHVFVDNGRCPTGQILKITAGMTHRYNPTLPPAVRRTRQCVPRPPGLGPAE